MIAKPKPKSGIERGTTFAKGGGSDRISKPPIRRGPVAPRMTSKVVLQSAL